MYENFATKYRPQIFDEVVGQEVAVKTLFNSLKSGKLGHAYLFFGPRGCGKTTVARIFAKSLNCHSLKNHIPCGKCSSCLEIARGKSLDVLEIDAASNTQVAKVRETIIESVDMSPARDRYKIYILDEVHMLSTSAFNALLKTIEEPPPHVIFIMATTDESKVPVTIISRCQSFRFKLISRELIIEKLKSVLKKEKIKFPKDNSLALISEASGGAMRDALTLLDRCVAYSGGEINAEAVKDMLGVVEEGLIENLALALLEKDAQRLHLAFTAISEQGYDAFSVLRDLRNVFAHAFLAAQGFSAPGGALVKKLFRGYSPGHFAKLSRNIAIIMGELRFSDSPILAAEMALFTLAEKSVDVGALVDKLSELESRISSAKVQTLPPDGHFEEDKKKTDEPRKRVSRGEGTLPIGNSEIWKKFLSSVYNQKPLLYNILTSMHLVFGEDDKWVLSSQNQYEVDMVLEPRNKDDIEIKLQKIAGRPIKVEVKCEKGSDAFAEDNSAARVEEAVENDAGDIWQDISGGEPFDAELKRVREIFRVKRIEKVSKNEKH